MAKNQEIFRTKSSRFLYANPTTSDINTLESPLQLLDNNAVLDISPGSDGSVVKSIKVHGATNTEISIYATGLTSNSALVAVKLNSPIISNSENTYELLEYLPSTKISDGNYYLSLESTRIAVIVNSSNAEVHINVIIEDY